MAESGTGDTPRTPADPSLPLLPSSLSRVPSVPLSLCSSVPLLLCSLCNPYTLTAQQHPYVRPSSYLPFSLPLSSHALLLHHPLHPSTILASHTIMLYGIPTPMPNIYIPIPYYTVLSHTLTSPISSTINLSFCRATSSLPVPTCPSLVHSCPSVVLSVCFCPSAHLPSCPSVYLSTCSLAHCSPAARHQCLLHTLSDVPRVLRVHITRRWASIAPPCTALTEPHSSTPRPRTARYSSSTHATRQTSSSTGWGPANPRRALASSFVDH